ncbi:unnamed protein product [Rotaria magnacalcarata]|uniref:Uncharacterized protein n=1 Tax=Rotaria magnacalcarata TaxID=392030 RepID=A0A8S2QAD5_9BILA|nr:unnamed protein product [Rotaria magnacalcarata]
MYFSQRLRELSKKETSVLCSTPINTEQNEANEIVKMRSSIDLKETADASTWGHVCFGETRACTASVASTNHASSLVRGTIWPCWSVRDASTMTDDLVQVTPKFIGNVHIGQGNPDPMVLMGYKAGEPVYRTTTALANALEGEHPGSYQLHEPALFPDVLIVECGLTQADITVRTEENKI